MEAIECMEACGFYVRALICDGATPNRKFFKLHGVPPNGDEDCIHWAPVKNDPRRRVYFICDPPHLIKTVRNNWEKSGWHTKTRNLEVRYIKEKN